MVGMLGTRQPTKKKAPLGATALPGDLSGAGGYGSEVVMPFVGAPACLPAIGFCDQREQIPIASRVCCTSSTRGGRHAIAGRKRASTTERPLLRYFGKRTRRAGTPQPWRRKRRGGNRAAKRVRGVARHRRPRPRRCRRNGSWGMPALRGSRQKRKPL
jgi:hypothetical protein